MSQVTELEKQVLKPEVVVFPRSTAHVSGIVKIANQFNLPFIGRGAGTGLSGGAIPRAGGIMINFARMNRILEIDLENHIGNYPVTLGQLTTACQTPNRRWATSGVFKPQGRVVASPA